MWISMASLLRPTITSNQRLREKLQRIARYHRWVILTIGFYLAIGIFGAISALSGGSPSAITSIFDNPVMRILGFAFFVFQVASVVLLIRELANTAVAAACGIVVIIPYCRLLILPMLIVLHIWATRRLKSYGIKIGLFGASPRTVGSIDG
jgi:small basic protein